MNVLKIIRNVVIGILLVVFWVFTIGAAVLLLSGNKYGIPQFGDTAIIMIKEDVSSDNYNKGNVVFVKEAKLENINQGDEIFVYKVAKDGTVAIDLGTVGEVYEDDDAISFENGGTYSAEFIAGKADKVYADVGTYLSLILSKWGFLLIFLVPNFLIFIWVLSALISEIKYGKEQTN